LKWLADMTTANFERMLTSVALQVAGIRMRLFAENEYDHWQTVHDDVASRAA
jgi:hypothetical protein